MFEASRTVSIGARFLSDTGCEGLLAELMFGGPAADSSSLMRCCEASLGGWTELETEVLLVRFFFEFVVAFDDAAERAETPLLVCGAISNSLRKA